MSPDKKPEEKPAPKSVSGTKRPVASKADSPPSKDTPARPAKPATPGAPGQPAATPPATPPAAPAKPAPATPAAPAAPARPAARPASSGEGSRQVDVSEGRLNAPGQGALKRIAPTRAQDVIKEQIARRTADPSKIKLPQFPAPASERPQALKDEEARREAIAEKERERRDAIIEGLDDEQRAKMEHDWAITDAIAPLTSS